MRWLLNWAIDALVARWMRSCPHDDRHVLADLHEGGAEPYGCLHGELSVLYCRRCGAVRTSHQTEWRSPAPLAPDGWNVYGWRRLLPEPYRWFVDLLASK
jgi:hypothetical protein